MEINRFDEAMGCIPVADVVEGRMGIFVAQTFSIDFGSQTDLPGFRVPATAEEAKRARKIITWQVTNQSPPYYVPVPSIAWGMRQGFNSASNVPFASTVYLTYPGHQDSVTIPSGTPSLALGKGTYTVLSGCYIYNANLAVPGSLLIVANTAEDTTDAGKLKYQATMDDRVVGFVEYMDTTSGELTFRIDR